MLKPRPYQMQMVDGVSAALRQGHRAVLVVAPTGAGKTIVIGYLVIKIHAAGKRVGVFAHRDYLLGQISAKLQTCEVDHNLLLPGQRSRPARVTVCSVQLARSRLDDPALQGLDYLIFDEAHHSITGDYMAIVRANPRARIVGPTATPERLDGLGLGVEHGGLYDVMVEGPTVASLTEEGYLVRATLLPSRRIVDLAEAKMRGGDYDPQSLAAINAKLGITGDAVARYRSVCPGEGAIAFCPTVASAYDVAAEFRADGWRWAAVDGKTRDRDEIFRDLAAGRLHGISSCDLVSEGLDLPNVACAIELRRSQSRCLVTQQRGRVLRPLEGTAGDLAAIAASRKPRAYILDHVGNTITHQHPETPRTWSLAGRAGRAAGEVVAVQHCPECYAAHPPAPSCPGCGHGYATAAVPAPAAARQQAFQVRTEADEYEIVTPARAALLRDTPLRQLVQKARTEKDLREIAEAKGYKAGWIERALQGKRDAHARHRVAEGRA